MSRLALGLICLLAFTSSAWAQGADDPDRVPGLDETSSGIIQAGPLAPIAVVEGPGIKVAEGTAIYPTVGADTGFVSNVFYQEGNPIAAGLFRLIAQVGTGSLNGRRLRPPAGGRANLGDFQHREELRLSYDFYLSGDDYVNEQNGLGIAATLRGTVYPQRTWSFLYLDTFERIIRATNFESTERLNRNINRLYLGVQYAPPGRSIRGMIRYTNTLDLFEDGDNQFANRMQNALGLTISWRVRPVTVLFADFNQGFYFGLGDATMYAAPKQDSYPLTAVVGVQTLLSLKTSLVARVGYTNGFYAGPSYSAATGGVDFGWRYSPMGRVTATYEYVHEDSINANFFRDHRVRLALTQQFVPFVVNVEPEIRFRQYRGVTSLIPTAPTDTRDDFIMAVSAAARYNFRDRYAAVAQYRFSTVQTDFRHMIDGDIDDPTFLRHEIILGFRAGL